MAPRMSILGALGEGTAHLHSLKGSKNSLLSNLFLGFFQKRSPRQNYSNSHQVECEPFSLEFWKLYV